MAARVKVLDFAHHRVGKLVRSSKICHTWQVKILNEVFDIDLYVSRRSNKVRIFINQRIVHKSKFLADIPFEYTFSIKNQPFELVLKEKKCDLIINSLHFSDPRLNQAPTENTPEGNTSIIYSPNKRSKQPLNIFSPENSHMRRHSEKIGMDPFASYQTNLIQPRGCGGKVMKGNCRQPSVDANIDRLNSHDYLFN